MERRREEAKRILWGLQVTLDVLSLSLCSTHQLLNASFHLSIVTNPIHSRRDCLMLRIVIEICWDF